MTSTTPARTILLLEHAAELARLLLKSTQAPRELTSAYLHKQKRLDSGERQFISSVTHHALRVWRFAQACACGVTTDVALRPASNETRSITAASCLLSAHGYLPSFIAEYSFQNSDSAAMEAAAELLLRESGNTAESMLLHAVRWENDAKAAVGKTSNSDSSASDGSVEEASVRTALAVRWSLPDWVLDSWREQRVPLSFAAIAEIGQGLCRAAPLTLRVNNLSTNRRTVLSELKAAGIPAKAHVKLPDAIVVSERQSLMDSTWYEAGMFEVQDAGSQLIGLACGVRPGLTVLDACAGAGGKTMHLADIMRDDGSIVACDIERKKLRGLEQRGNRLSLQSLYPIAVKTDGHRQDGREPYAEDVRFDCILVDAPCSGFGTVRRHPALKWRLTEKTVLRLANRQEELLTRHAAFVREGGILLYATCSLLPQENADILRRFLVAHQDFSLTPLAPQFALAGVALHGRSPDEGALQLSPTILDSDGFFMARLMRNYRF